MPFSEMAKWHFLTAKCNLNFLGDQMPLFEVLSLCDFIQNMFQVPSKCLSKDKLPEACPWLIQLDKNG